MDNDRPSLLDYPQNARTRARATANRVDTLMDHMDLHKNMNVLVLDCGAGPLMTEIATKIGKGGTVIGLEREQTRVDEVQRVLNSYGMSSKFEVVRSDFTELPRVEINWPEDGPAAFDVVVCLSALHELSNQKDRVELLKWCTSMLAKDGKLFVEHSVAEGVCVASIDSSHAGLGIPHASYRIWVEGDDLRCQNAFGCTAEMASLKVQTWEMTHTEASHTDDKAQEYENRALQEWHCGLHVKIGDRTYLKEERSGPMTCGFTDYVKQHWAQEEEDSLKKLHYHVGLPILAVRATLIPE